MSLECAIFMGYFYATILAALPVFWVMHLMWSILRSQTPTRSTNDGSLHPNEWQTITIGIIERSLYLTAILIGKPEFIAVWLTLKTVSQSKRWSENHFGRAIYNNFLVGNSLSILFAFAGAGIIQWTVGSDLVPMDIVIPAILEKNYTLAWLSGLVPITFSLLLAGCLFIVLKVNTRKNPK
jgi:hypothetical protein